MNDSRSSTRLKLGMLLVLSATMAAGSLWVREVMLRGIDNTLPDALRTEPDYFVEKFNFVRTSKTGQARYAISGAKLTHFPANDNYVIDLPLLKSLSVNRPSLTMRAQRATVNSDASEVRMMNNVQADRPESKTTPFFHLESEYLQIFPDDDILQTDRAVRILQGNAEITGEGMLANNATLNFKLSHNVHAVLQPRRH